MQTQTKTIRASLERVFHCIDDPELRKQWQKGLEETVYTHIPEGGNPVGIRFVARIREGGRVAEYEGELTEYHKPERLAVKVGNKAFTIATRYRLAPDGEGTRLHLDMEIELHSMVAKIMFLIGGPLLKRIARKQLDTLVALAENDGPAPSG